MRILYDNSGLMIVLSELTWRAPLLLLEDAVEVAEIVESAIKTYLADALRGIYQHAGSITQTQVDNILRDVSARMELEESAEGTRAHTRQRGEIRQTEFIHIVLRDIVLYLQNTSAVILHRYLGIAARCQGSRILTLRQFIKNGEKLLHGIKAILYSTQGIQQMIYLHYRLQGKAKSFLRLLHHAGNAGIRISAVPDQAM